MTVDDYLGLLRALGLTKRRQTYDSAAIYETRDGQFTNVPDPNDLSPEERIAMIALIRSRLNL